MAIYPAKAGKIPLDGLIWQLQRSNAELALERRNPKTALNSERLTSDSRKQRGQGGREKRKNINGPCNIGLNLRVLINQRNGYIIIS